MTEETRSDQILTDAPQKTQTRRQLLKVLAGTGVAAGMLALPNKWTKPVVEVGVLPVHAQGSEQYVPPYSLLECAVIAVQRVEGVDAESGVPIGLFYTNSILGMSAAIMPGAAGIQLKRTVTLNQTGHPHEGVLNEWTGPTGVGGILASPNFDLGGVACGVSPGVDRIVVTWSFVDPAVGLGVCSTSIEISAYV